MRKQTHMSAYQSLSITDIKQLTTLSQYPTWTKYSKRALQEKKKYEITKHNNIRGIKKKKKKKKI